MILPLEDECERPLSVLKLFYFNGGTQCDQIWRNFATLAKFCKSLGNFEKLKLVFGNFVNLLGQIDKLLGKFPLL